MNKKLVTILALLIVAGSISAVSAFDLGDIFGSGENQTVTVSGLKFNIPDGYEEVAPTKDVTEMFDNLTVKGANITYKLFTKDSSAIVIATYNNLTDSQIKEFMAIDNNATNTTIDGINGTITRTTDGVSMFTYSKEGKVVMVSAESKEVISEVIKA